MYQDTKENAGLQTSGTAGDASPGQKRLLQNTYSPKRNSPFPSYFSAHLSPLMDFSNASNTGPLSLLGSPCNPYDPNRSPLVDFSSTNSNAEITPSLSCLMALRSPSLMNMRTALGSGSNSQYYQGNLTDLNNANSLNPENSNGFSRDAFEKMFGQNSVNPNNSGTRQQPQPQSNRPNFQCFQKLEYNEPVSNPDKSYWKQREQSSSYDSLGFLGPNYNSNDSLSSLSRFLLQNNNSNLPCANTLQSGGGGNIQSFAAGSTSTNGIQNTEATPVRRHLRIVNGQLVNSPEPGSSLKSQLPPKANLRGNEANIGESEQARESSKKPLTENAGITNSNDTPTRNKRRAGEERSATGTVFGSASKRSKMNNSKAKDKPEKLGKPPLHNGRQKANVRRINQLKSDSMDCYSTPPGQRTKQRAPLSAMARLTMSSPNTTSETKKMDKSLSSRVPKLRPEHEGKLPIPTKQNLDDQQPCNCKKSKCLKLYCDCFALNLFCMGGCKCIDCRNLENREEERVEAINTILERNPQAFKPKFVAVNSDGTHSKGCHCKKSGCLKKYCECYNANVRCGPNCKCEGCKNVTLKKSNKHNKPVLPKKHSTSIGKTIVLGKMTGKPISIPPSMNKKSTKNAKSLEKIKRSSSSKSTGSKSNKSVEGVPPSIKTKKKVSVTNSEQEKDTEANIKNMEKANAIRLSGRKPTNKTKARNDNGNNNVTESTQLNTESSVMRNNGSQSKRVTLKEKENKEKEESTHGTGPIKSINKTKVGLVDSKNRVLTESSTENIMKIT